MSKIIEAIEQEQMGKEVPAFAPGDNFHRRVITTTVSIQNIRSLNMMGF